MFGYAKCTFDVGESLTLNLCCIPNSVEATVTHQLQTQESQVLVLLITLTLDGLVGHHWKERPIGYTNFICPSTGARQGQKKWEWVGREVGGEGMRDFWDSIGNVIEENT